MIKTKEDIHNSTSFCLMPWLHLHVSTRGLAQACCISPITFGNINKQSISEIWNGSQINTFRDKLLNNEKDKRCNGCYQREASGNSSIRTETLQKFKHHIPTVLNTSLSVSPIYLDIRFSNICNFRCVTCWHGASSKWFEEAKESGTNISDQAIIKAIDNESDFFNQLDSLIPNLEEIYFAGGEPLIMDQHYRLLDLLLEKNKTSIHLRYNTNLSLLNFKNNNVLDYWKNFEKVTISASIDASGQVGEQIRRDSNWKIIKNNLKLIRDTLPTVKLEIAPTVSSLNILKIHSLHQELVEENLIGINAIYFNLLERPYSYSIKESNHKLSYNTALNEYSKWLTLNSADSKTINMAESIKSYISNN